MSNSNQKTEPGSMRYENDGTMELEWGSARVASFFKPCEYLLRTDRVAARSNDYCQGQTMRSLYSFPRHKRRHDFYLGVLVVNFQEHLNMKYLLLVITHASCRD